jgi:undecaprenyl pyrophosphate phosphatase UppP
VLSYPQAIVIGLLQGVTELFPVSSLGHSVLVPAWLGWLLVVATIPAGLVGIGFEHALRTLFAKPLAAAVFLTCNGLILLGGERLRRRASDRQQLAEPPDPAERRPAGPRGARQASGVAFS